MREKCSMASKKGDSLKKAKRVRTNTPVYDMFSRGALLPEPETRATDSAAGADAPLESGGYARVRPGESQRGGRYVAGGELGQGIVASVIRAVKVETGTRVAIKLSRANATMRRRAARTRHSAPCRAIRVESSERWRVICAASCT